MNYPKVAQKIVPNEWQWTTMGGNKATRSEGKYIE